MGKKHELLYKPVKALSTMGRFKLWLLNFIYALYEPIMGRTHPMMFNEDPSKMTWRESLYLGYKYYYKSPEPEPEVEAIFSARNSLTVPSKQRNNQNSITLGIGGDLMPYALINRVQCANLWDHCGPHFFNHDVVFANMETPIHPLKKPSLVPEIMLNHMEFNASKEQPDIFNGMGLYKGFNVLSFANNHTLDQGLSGILQTHEYLSKKNIQCIGVNPRRTRGGDLALTRFNGITIGWFAYTFSFNHLSLPQNASYIANKLPLNEPEHQVTEQIESKIQKLRNMGAEFIIGSFHMGNAYQPMPEKTMLQRILSLVEQSSMDLFVGSHPHNPQPCLIGRNKVGKQVPIICSTGDFIAYDIYTFGHLTQTLSIRLDRDPMGGVVVTQFKELYYYMLLRKNKTLQLIPFEQVIADPEKWVKEALFESEVTKLIQYYSAYLAPYLITQKEE